jgi:hypothetical protein
LPCDKSEQRRIFNKIYIGLTRFEHFDPNIASVFDPVPNNLPGEKREFDTSWWPDWPYRVAVQLNNNVSSHMVTAATLNLHPLVGIRRWGVHWLYNDKIEIYTDAWEKPGGPTRKAGMIMLGRHLQKAMWNNYLSNIGNFWNGREGVIWEMPINGSGVMDGPVSESDGKQPNPFNVLLPKLLQFSSKQ